MYTSNVKYVEVDGRQCPRMPWNDMLESYDDYCLVLVDIDYKSKERFVTIIDTCTFEEMHIKRNLYSEKGIRCVLFKNVKDESWMTTTSEIGL